MRLIDADAFKKILSEHEMKHDQRRSFDDYDCGAANAYEHASDLLDDMPTITIPVAELDTTNDFAKWIDVNGDGSIMKCSKCGEEVCCKGNNFCPKCGSDNRRKISFVTNAEEAKEYPIMKKKDADKIAEAFKRLHCKYRTENSECEKTNDDCFPDSIPWSCLLKRGETE